MHCHTTVFGVFGILGVIFIISYFHNNMFIIVFKHKSPGPELIGVSVNVTTTPVV